LIASASHDTGAAVAGIPDAGTDWAFISSGTWSLVGMPLEEPCTNEVARREDFTNEGGIAGRIRFLKNVNGMWLIEECLREWRAQGVDWKVADLVAECARRPIPQISFPVNSPDLILPGNMPGRINRELEKAGHAPLSEEGQHAPAMASVIFVSLAARYAEILKGIQEATGQQLHRVYIVGGGSQNEFLNGLIAERSGLKVVRGPVESSTVGNVAVQFAALDTDSPKGVTPAAVAEWARRLATAS
jgi:rhamnulokinase